MAGGALCAHGADFRRLARDGVTEGRPPSLRSGGTYGGSETEAHADAHTDTPTPKLLTLLVNVALTARPSSHGLTRLRLRPFSHSRPSWRPAPMTETHTICSYGCGVAGFRRTSTAPPCDSRGR